MTWLRTLSVALIACAVGILVGVKLFTPSHQISSKNPLSVDDPNPPPERNAGFEGIGSKQQLAELREHAAALKAELGATPDTEPAHRLRLSRKLADTRIRVALLEARVGAITAVALNDSDSEDRRSLSNARRLLDASLSQIEEGRFGIYAPDAMVRNERYTVVLGLSRDETKVLSDSVQDRHDPGGAIQIIGAAARFPSFPAMQAELLANSDFAITPSGPRNVILTPDGAISLTEWRVQPLKLGKLSMTLRLRPNYSVLGADAPKVSPEHDTIKTIEVTAESAKVRFVSEVDANWPSWIIAFVSFGGGIIATFFGSVIKARFPAKK